MKAGLVGPLTALAGPEHAEYDAFVETSAHGTIFQTTWWHRAWEMDFTCLASRSHGSFCTGLVVGHAPPLTPYSGPVIELPRGLTAGDGHNWRKQETLRVIGSLPPGSPVRFQLTPDQFDFTLYAWAGFRVEPSLTYKVRSERGADWRCRASRATRAAVAKAERRLAACGGSVVRVEHLGELRGVFHASAHRQGFWLADGLDRCWRDVQAREVGTLYAARDGRGEVLCAALAVRDRKAVYYLVGGVDTKASTGSFMPAVMARMIDDALGEGLDFDFEGSLLIGVERFFRGFGGELVPLVRIFSTRSSQARGADLSILARRLGVSGAT